MDLSTIANVATALTVLTGVGFGLIEMRRARREREERAAFAAVQALMSPRVDELGHDCGRDSRREPGRRNSSAIR